MLAEHAGGASNVPPVYSSGCPALGIAARKLESPKADMDER